MGRAEAFLEAFSQIEGHLRRVTRSSKEESFGKVLSKAKSSSRIVDRYRDDLRQFAELRNAIVHQWREQDPIADPREDTVQQITRMFTLIADPPKVMNLDRPQVVTCEPSDTVGRAARMMYDNNFSQIPVYTEAKEWKGLITAETITRWMAARFEENHGILEDELVAAILSFREDSSIEVFFPKHATVFEVADAFDDATHRGQNLDALLITETGDKDQTPLMILTVFDLPQLYRLIDS